MADYNIFIHSASNYESPTTPLQMKGDSGESGVGGESGSGGSGLGFARRAAAFILNPDSAIGSIMNAPAGAIGKSSKAGGIVAATVMLAITTAFSIVDKVVTTYNAYSSSASGDYSNMIHWNNTKKLISNILHPFSTELSRQQAELQIKLKNAENEQEMLLTGGSIYNSRYGRYL